MGCPGPILEGSLQWKWAFKAGIVSLQSQKQDVFPAPYKKVGFIRGEQSPFSTLWVSLRDVGSPRHADIQASALAVLHKPHFLSVLGDWRFLPVSVKQEQLACK